MHTRDKENKRRIMESNRSDEMLLERGFMPQPIESLRHLCGISVKRELVEMTRAVNFPFAWRNFAYNER
jgi:hypothetical protein